MKRTPVAEVVRLRRTAQATEAVTLRQTARAAEVVRLRRAPQDFLHATERRGAFMVVVIVCLLVSTLIIAALLKLALLQSRRQIHEQHRVQAEWLADSALERVASRLSGDPGYQGETWSIEAAELGGRDGARVTIRVEADKSQTDNRRVEIEAIYPAEGPQPVRRRLTATIAVLQES